MRQITLPELERCRRDHPEWGSSPFGENYGFFVIPILGGGELRVLSSGSGDEWEHVSVSLENRCPTWAEMCRVKDLFWMRDETVLQFHPRLDQYVNCHEFCLHLWKQRNVNAPLPPRNLI